MMEPKDKAMMLEILKKMQSGEIESPSIPMEASELEEMTPEKAMELDKLPGRAPASSDMEAEALQDFAPQGNFVGGKLGQQVSPDVAQSPEMDAKQERLAKLKALFQSK